MLYLFSDDCDDPAIAAAQAPPTSTLAHKANAMSATQAYPMDIADKPTLACGAELTPKTGKASGGKKQTNNMATTQVR